LHQAESPAPKRTDGSTCPPNGLVSYVCHVSKAGKRSMRIVMVTVLALAAGAAFSQEITLTAIRYGMSRYSSEYIFMDDTIRTPLEFHWLFYLLRTDARIVLIDCGFSDPEMARRFGVRLEDPVELLEKIGVQPEAVTDIVATHAHFDHIGNIDRFPNATLWIHANAWQSFMNGPFSVPLAAAMKKKVKLSLFNEEIDPFPFMEVIPVEGHAPGSCYVRLNLKDRTIILTGDEAYLPENWQKLRGVGTYVDSDKNMKALREFKELSDMPDVTLFTFHDPAIIPEGSAQVWRQLYP
jgi:glyoxylase-like metal-dependent hydrolase (beta-lactamase superfamily II)